MPRVHLLRLPLNPRLRRRRIMLLLLLLLLVLLPLLVLYTIYRPPHLLILYLQSRNPSVLFHVPLPAGKRMVALSVDDAPSIYTEEILGVLREEGMKGTFFTIGGQVREVHGGVKGEELLGRLVREGMELGNHAMHDVASVSLESGKLTEEIGEVEGLIKGAYVAAGRKEDEVPRFFRPGSGFFNSRMLEQLKEMGYRLVLGSVYPHDAQVPWAWLNARHILGKVRSGSILICHDRRSWTAPMLRKVLPDLKRRGYEVVTVSRLIEEGEKAKKSI